MMTPDRLILLLTAEMIRAGTVPQHADAPQVRDAAERLIQLMGGTTVEPPRELPAAALDSPTMLLPVQTEQPQRRPWPNRRYADVLYGRRR